VREFFLLRQAERRISERTNPQQRSVRAHWDAAARRLSVARQLRAPNEASVALSLYRGAALFLTYAVILSRDEGVDVESLGPEGALLRLDRALEGDHVQPSVSFEAARRWLAVPDPLAFDRLSAEDASLRRSELAAATRWLETLVEPRSPKELILARVSRVAVGVLCSIALAAFLVARLASPENVARGKFATSSSVAEGTTPAGAVDGSKNGSFGFHSDEEDSPWLTIDLGGQYKIASVRVFGRGDCCFDQSIPLALEASEDDATFHEIAARSEKFGESDPWIVKLGPLVTRYLRLRTERRSVLVLSEVEVYGARAK
jgi:hypothetical protein